MPSKDRQRELARKKLERHMARRAASAKRRRQIFAGAGASATLLLLVAVVVIVILNRDEEKSPSAIDPTCVYLNAADDPSRIKDVGKPNTTDVSDSGNLNVQLNTNFGRLDLQLDQGAAPCTVNSFRHLLRKSFFDNTLCHRLTTPPQGFFVLQCGSPFSDGRDGGPSYQFGVENTPTKDHPPYPVGSVAMAHKANDPNSNGSQFFIVYANSDEKSQLPPEYSLIGKVTSGLDVITTKIVPNGVKNEEEPGSGDGAPAKDVVIEKAQLG